MRGLLLTNYYLVYRTLFVYTGVEILASGIILYFGDMLMYRLIAMLTTLLMAMPALEVIKYESKSGYDKYVLTLPITRRHVVQSHYCFYFIVVSIGTLLAYGIFCIHGLVLGRPIDERVFNTVSSGTFIVLNAGAIAYPLLYVFGAEKSDAITIGGACGGLLATFGLQSFIGYLIEKLPFLNSLLYIPVLYTLFGVMIYIISYSISVFLYNKKEF